MRSAPASRTGLAAPWRPWNPEPGMPDPLLRGCARAPSSSAARPGRNPSSPASDGDAGPDHLVRKQDLSRARGSGRRRASADGLWVTVSGGSGGGGLELAGVGVDGLDRDLVAEAFQAADGVAGLAAGVHARVAGVGRQVGGAG